MLDDTTGQSSVLTTYCLTEDDEKFLTDSTTQHVDNYQELLEACQVSTRLNLYIYVNNVYTYM